MYYALLRLRSFDINPAWRAPVVSTVISVERNIMMKKQIKGTGYVGTNL